MNFDNHFLKNSFEAHEATVEMPEIYASFHNLPKYNKLFGEMASGGEMPYSLLREAGWNLITMNLDREQQGRTREELRSTVANEEEDGRLESYGEYWNKLENDSAYSLYRKYLKAFDRDEKSNGIVKKLDEFSSPQRMYRKKFRPHIESAGYFYKNIYNDVLATQAFGSSDKQLRNVQNLRNQIQSVSEKQEDFDGDKMESYMCGIYVEKAAREIALEKIQREVDMLSKYPETYLSEMMQMSMEEYIQSRLDYVEPYNHIATVFAQKLKAFEEQEFTQDQVDTVATLWRMVFYLKTSELPDHESATQFRQPLIEALAKGDYEEAKKVIATQYLTRPGVFDKKYLERVGIDEEYIKLRAEELKATQTKTLEERDRDLVEKILKYVDTTFSNADGTVQFTLRKMKGTDNRFFLDQISLSDGTVSEALERYQSSRGRRIRYVDFFPLCELLGMNVVE